MSHPNLLIINLLPKSFNSEWSKPKGHRPTADMQDRIFHLTLQKNPIILLKIKKGACITRESILNGKKKSETKNLLNIPRKLNIQLSEIKVKLLEIQ